MGIINVVWPLKEAINKLESFGVKPGLLFIEAINSLCELTTINNQYPEVLRVLTHLRASSVWPLNFIVSTWPGKINCILYILNNFEALWEVSEGMPWAAEDVVQGWQECAGPCGTHKCGDACHSQLIQRATNQCWNCWCLLDRLLFDARHLHLHFQFWFWFCVCAGIGGLNRWARWFSFGFDWHIWYFFFHLDFTVNFHDQLCFYISETMNTATRMDLDLHYYHDQGLHLAQGDQPQHQHLQVHQVHCQCLLLNVLM